MSGMFHSNGKLKIPVPRKHVRQKSGKLVVNEAYCPQGHNLMSEVKVDDERGIRLIYTDESGAKETEIVISPVVGKCEKRVLKGEAFKDGDIVKILCPDCRMELPVLCDCECGAPIYLFYLDNSMNPRYAQSVCSRVGCVRASELRHTEDEIRRHLEV